MVFLYFDYEYHRTVIFNMFPNTPIFGDKNDILSRWKKTQFPTTIKNYYENEYASYAYKLLDFGLHVCVTK